MDCRRVIECTVKNPWFELIRLGFKTVEGRTADGKFRDAASLDTLIISNQLGTCSVVKEIAIVVRYDSFRDMLMHEGLERCLPGVKTLERGVEIYNEIYSADREACGVLAIKFA